jgi:glycosyltransferase involved in cell wall biosynthesis
LSGGGVARHLKIPYICVVTGLGYTFLHNGFLYFLTKILYRLAFQKAEKIIFESIEDKFLFNQLGICSPEKSLSVKGCGINIHHFTPQPSKKNVSTTIFTFIGRFLYDKGLLEFVAAARLVKKTYPKTIFWLVGEIDYSNLAAISETELQSWIQEGIVIHQGFATDVRPFITASDCIVLPSYREAIPRVLQESMAMKRVVITTDVAGCRETVDNNVNGFLVTAKTVAPLAAAMIQFIELPEGKRREMEQNARAKVEREFDERLIAAEFLKVIADNLAFKPHDEKPFLKNTSKNKQNESSKP